MGQVTITTAQNVQISIATADVGRRIAAHVLDVLVKVGFVLFFVLIISQTALQRALRSSDAFFYWLTIILLPIVFYTLLFEYFMQGQTPGKRVMRIKVVKLSGRELSFGDCLIRWMFSIIDIGFYGLVAILCIAFSKLNQRLGDMVAGTIVIDIRDKIKIEETLFEETTDEYEIKYPQVDRLSSTNIQTIKDVLKLYSENKKHDLLEITSLKIQEILGVTIDKQSHENFLKTIITDYNCIGKTEQREVENFLKGS